MRATRNAAGHFEVDRIDALVYTPAEAAAVLRCGINELYRLVATGLIPSIRWGAKSIVIPKRALEDAVTNEAIRQQQQRQAEQLPSRPTLQPAAPAGGSPRPRRRQHV
jgi:excisionase family DNA binding protein